MCSFQVVLESEANAASGQHEAALSQVDRDINEALEDWNK